MKTKNRTQIDSIEIEIAYNREMEKLSTSLEEKNEYASEAEYLQKKLSLLK